MNEEPKNLSNAGDDADAVDRARPPADRSYPLTDHAYDGIHEYDNPMPGWWKVLLIGTIVFAALYFTIDITTSGQMSPVASYDQSLVEDAKLRFGSMVLKPDAATLLKLSKDSLFQKMGNSIFQTNCASCHGRHAEGMSQCPNLTDDYYLDVKKITDIVDVITKGRNYGAMPTWGNRLQPNEIIVVASYVASLRGTNYPGGKRPEGTIPPPWTDH